MKNKELLGIVLILGAFLLLFSINIPTTDSLKELVQERTALGMVLFTALMFLATVVAPLAVLPLVPIVAPLFGPFITALLSILGWWLGAVVAFLIARHGGRPLLARYVSLKEIKRYEDKIPAHLTFWSLVLLRMVIPVDILSYAIGLFSSIRLVPYSLATLIGITPFAFVFAYAGSAIISMNVLYILSLAVFALVLWGIVAALLKR